MVTHPNYPNPQLAEALCEFHFELTQAHPWKPNKPGDFFKAVQDNYPEIEPITEQGVQLTVGPDGILAPQLLPPRIRFKFTHKDRPLALQISEQTFTINALKPYPGWEPIKLELKSVWPKFLELAQPASLARVGMRYVNRIRRRTIDEMPSFWLKPSKYIPIAVLESRSDFQARLQARIDAINRVTITLAHDRSDKSEAHGALILDIDRIFEGKLSVDWDKVDTEIEKLHQDVWKIFDSTRGPNLEALLKGDQNFV